MVSDLTLTEGSHARPGSSDYSGLPEGNGGELGHTVSIL